MGLDSYEKASLNILEYLKKDPEILVIDWVSFNYLIYLAQGLVPSILGVKREPLFYVSIFDVIPNVFSEINRALPYPDSVSLRDKHFTTELISCYGEAWIPLGSPDYQMVLEVSYLDEVDMLTWQRYVRASLSKDEIELTALLVDPDETVRCLATRRLKTL